MYREIKWCCIGKNGRFDYTSLSYLRRDSIRKFVTDCDPVLKTDQEIKDKWKYWQNKFGWECVKVLVTIEQVKKI